MTLQSWLHKKSRRSVAIVGIVVSMFGSCFLAYSINSYQTTQLNRVHRFAKLVELATEQKNRVLAESLLNMSALELNADVVAVCVFEELLLAVPGGYEKCPQQTGRLRRYKTVPIHGSTGSKLVFIYPWLPSGLNLPFVLLVFLVTLILCFTQLRNIRKAFESDILVPLQKSIFGDAKLNILELERLRIQHKEIQNFEQKKIEIEIFDRISRQVIHDIRSPIGALRSAEKSMDSKPVVAGEVIKKAVRRIEDIVGDLSRQMQSPKPGREPVSLNEIVNDIKVEKSAEHQNLTMRSTVNSPQSIYVTIRKKTIMRILSNIINNAVEATVPGRAPVIILRIKKLTNNRVSITVQDNGRGIAANDLRHVTDEGFTKGKPGGTGIGLAYTKSALNEEGGHISISSELGVGTQVTLTLQTSESSAHC